MGQFSFGKAERLKKEILLNTLFEKGKAVSWNGFTLVYLAVPLPTTLPVQIGFSVPKKNFKNATDRNKIKRRMREAYRHQKSELYQFLHTNNIQLAMMLIYKGKEVPEYKTVVEAILKNITNLLLKVGK